MSIISDEYLKTRIYVDENVNTIGTFVIDTENWIQPSNENEIVKVTSFVANVATTALLKSHSLGLDKFDVTVYLEKFKVSHMNYKFIGYLSDILKQLFPEKLRNAIIIDPPKFFITGYEIIKKFLDKPTRKKLHLVKNNKEVYFDNLED